MFGTMVLVETEVASHVLITLAGNIVSYLFRADVAEYDSGLNKIEKRVWAACTVTVVVLLVGGIWKSNHRSVQFLSRKFSAMSEILAMSNEQMEKIPEKNSLTPPTSNYLSGSTLSSSDPASPMVSASVGSAWIEGLETLHCVGQGSFGSVYFCRYQKRDCAVKVMTWQQKTKSKVNPIREAELCLKLRHPNLVQTYTFFTREVKSKKTVQEMWIIQEWCDLGTLNNYASTQPYERPKGRSRIKDILIDVCKATAYLHASDVIHGDLTSNNVLLQSLAPAEAQEEPQSPKTKVLEEDSAVSDSFNCKVCDFGMARVLEEGITELLTSQLGTVSHMPPELLHMEHRRLSKKADIWAIGMLLYEIVAGEIPYRGMMVPSIILFVATGKRLSLPEHVEKDLLNIFRLCQADLDDRPTAEELLSMLQE